VTIKNAVFWVVTPCGSTANVVPNWLILFTLMMVGDTCLRNVGSYKSHTASYIGRLHSSTSVETFKGL
jgi:hypothetical protein